MKLFSSKADKVEEKLSNVFTPAAPVSLPSALKGRKVLIEDIKRAYRRKGACIVLYGERGVGKTSIAKVVASVLKGDNFYYSASADDDFESIGISILSKYQQEWDSVTRERTDVSKKDAQIGFSGTSGGLGHERQSTFIEQPMSQTKLTSHEIATRLPSKKGLIIIDDFERLSSSKIRAQFSDLIKKFSDNEVEFTLMIVGIANNIEELLAAHESAQRSIAEVKVPRLESIQIKKIVTDGMAELELDIDPDCVDQIVEFSAHFPYYTHLLCEGSVVSLISRIRNGEKNEYKVTQDEVKGAIDYAIRNAEHSISDAYSSSVSSIRESPRFKYTLYAIASWPAERVAYRDICKWVGKVSKAPSGEVNVSHQLKKLEESGVIDRESYGLYCFINPILKAYVMLKVRADTPSIELSAIDAQIKHIQKQITRFEKSRADKK